MNRKKRDDDIHDIHDINKKHTLKGGRFIASGSFGCVVSPALPCKKTKKALNNINNKYNLNHKTNKLHQTPQSVSKIIISPDKEADDELSISNKLRKIDPKTKYFITIEDACYIKDLPDNRSDAIKVHYNDYNEYNDTGTYTGTDTDYIILDKTKPRDKEYCKVDIRLKPINFILPYGGYDLFDILRSKSKEPNLAITRKLLIKQFKYCFKNLLYGIFKMQEHRIVNFFW